MHVSRHVSMLTHQMLVVRQRLNYFSLPINTSRFIGMVLSFPPLPEEHPQSHKPKKNKENLLDYHLLSHFLLLSWLIFHFPLEFTEGVLHIVELLLSCRFLVFSFFHLFSQEFCLFSHVFLEFFLWLIEILEVFERVLLPNISERALRVWLTLS